MIDAMMSLQRQKTNNMFEEQRKLATFDKKLLSLIIYNTKEQHEDFLRRQSIVDNDPILKFDPATLQRSRAELMQICAKKLIRYSQLFPPGQIMHGYKNIFFDDQLPLGLHDSMFLITLRNLCDAQQQKTILEPAQKGQILGCYAQTQLGHGSDVQRLMTTATYDPQTETFILNTPQAKAAKWWIGDLGVFCTHACVFAQLITKGKNHGVHAFLTPIRDSNHKPYPGLQVGDVGPKMGFQTKDNGYLIMKNYRIPRTNMLMKFHRVAKDGTYSISGNQKVTYATMLMIRSVIPFLSFYKTSRAVTILTRYSLYRRQFKDNKGKQMPILDYQLQQEKIFPRISEVFANLFAFKAMHQLSKIVLQQAHNNKFDKLQQSHIITSSIKAITTKDGLKSLQILRRAGGGHTFSSYSGIPSLQTQLIPAFTYQGQYTILHLQVARYLLKNIDRTIKGKSLDSSVSYFSRLSESFEPVNTDDIAVLTSSDNLINFFEQHSLERMKKAAQRIQNGMQIGMKLKNAWDQYSGLELVDAATAHGYNLMVKYYLLKINQYCKDQRLKSVLIDLFQLYAIQKICDYSVSFYETGVLGPISIKTYRLIREKLLTKIRPNALTLVQAFDYSDNTLHSAIGGYEGKSYETLLEWAKNKNDVNQSPHSEDIRKKAIWLRQQIQSKTKTKAKL